MMRFKVDKIDNHETSKMFEGILLDLYGGNYSVVCLNDCDEMI